MNLDLNSAVLRALHSGLEAHVIVRRIVHGSLSSISVQKAVVSSNGAAIALLVSRLVVAGVGPLEKEKSFRINKN